MGQAKIRQYSRQKFLEAHPWCCYCGARATTTDHCPPRAMFKDRQWPEGYEFPCCDPCNTAGRKCEQIAVAILRPSLTQETNDEKWLKTIHSLKINHPEIIKEWTEKTRNEMRRLFREKFGSELGDLLRKEGYGILHVGPITTAEIEDFLFRLSQALFYKYTGRRCSGGKVWALRTDATVIKSAIDDINRIIPLTSKTYRGNVDLSDQFFYQYNFSPSEGIFCAVLKIREQFRAMLTVMEQPHATTFLGMSAGRRVASRDCPP